MDSLQLSKTAQSMFLHNKGRKEVIDFLTENGIANQEAETMATEAYRAIKDQRKAALEAQYPEPETPVGGGGMGSIVVGGLFILGGIVLTMNTNRIWYGLMLVGAVALFKGLADQMK